MFDQQGPRLHRLPVAADVLIRADAMAGTDDEDHAVPAAHPRCRVVLGRADYETNNLGGLKGAQQIVIGEGTFTQDQDGSIAQPDLGKPCFAVDDNTVSLSDAGGTRPRAGAIVPVQKQPFTAASRVMVCFDSAGDEAFDVAN